MSKKIWLIYALGGGWGHLNRSLALARSVTKQYQIKIITNNYYLDYIESDQCEIIAIPTNKNFKQTQEAIQNIILKTKYDCLIVDTFPCGLGGELRSLIPHISQTKVLVNRYLNPNYIQQYQIDKFVKQYYDLILIPGENTISPFTNLPQTFKTEPWLIRDRDELPNLSTTATLLD